MSVKGEKLRGLFEGPVKRAKGAPPIAQEMKAKAKRVVSQAPEVMVKVSGAAKGVGHLKAHLDYITRNGELEAENERGQVIKGRDAVDDLHGDWCGRMGKRQSQAGGNSRASINMVLSMPPGTDPDGVKEAVRLFAKEQFAKNHQYVMALHTDEDHPHVHLTVKAVGFDGKKLNPRKRVLEVWRESFAEKLRERGIDAEATPRELRGIIRKKEKAAVHHMKERGVMPDTTKAKYREAANELAGKGVTPKPWEPAIVAKQNQIRRTWVEAAKELAESQEPDDKALAAGIVRFVQKMPKLETERHQIKEELLRQVQRDKAQSKEPAEGHTQTRPERKRDQDMER